MQAVSADWVLLDDGFSPNLLIEHQHGAIVAIREGRAADHVAGALLPGAINLHSHAFQRSFAGRTEFAGGGGDFWSWREAMYRAAGRIDPDTLAPVAAYLGMQCLLGGFTSLVEFHYLQNAPDGSPYAHRAAMADAVIEGAARSGIGLTLLFGIYETGDFGGAPLQGGQIRFDTAPEAALAMLQDAQPRQTPSLRFGLSPHSLRAVPPASLARMAEGLAGIDPAAPIHIHAAEQQAEVLACRAHLGTTPVAWLLDNVSVAEKWCLIHCTHTNDAERRGLAASGAVAGLCPSTEGNLGDGIFGLADYVSHGGAFGIGTDSHVSLDAFAELRLLEYSQRLRAERRNVLAGEDGHTGRILWQAACNGGARASARRVGALRAGSRADLVAITPTIETAGLGPDFWLDAAMFANDRASVHHAMVGGEWLVRDGTHIHAEDITRAYTRVLEKIG